MSIVAAIAVPDRAITVIGCDQRVGSVMVPTKWVRQGCWAIGVSGVYRVLALIEQREGAPQRSPLEVGVWLRDVLLEDGFQPRDDAGGPQSFDTEILLARAGRLWALDASLTPTEVPPGELAAVGSGREYARGAAYALDAASLDYRMHTSIQAAIDLEFATCGGEPVVEWLSE